MTSSELALPQTVKGAGYLAIAQSVIGLGYAALLVIREFLGDRNPGVVTDTDTRATMLGYGTAAYFIVIFGAVLAGALSMNAGRRWGRGPVAMLEMFLLVVGYYMFTAGQPVWATIVAASGLAGLVLLFHPKSLEWASARHR